jgi:hypothetical protein
MFDAGIADLHFFRLAFYLWATLLATLHLYVYHWAAPILRAFRLVIQPTFRFVNRFIWFRG